jgi:hypothetical protein
MVERSTSPPQVRPSRIRALLRAASSRASCVWPKLYVNWEGPPPAGVTVKAPSPRVIELGNGMRVSGACADDAEDKTCAAAEAAVIMRASEPRSKPTE